MNHRIIDTEELASSERMIIYQKDNNIDKFDNIDEIPEQPAVYAICGRVNDQPANCRKVGTTENLKETISTAFSDAEPDSDFKTFMHSIKIKEMIYYLMPETSEKERKQVLKDWENKLQPACTEELNKVY